MRLEDSQEPSPGVGGLSLLGSAPRAGSFPVFATNASESATISLDQRTQLVGPGGPSCLVTPWRLTYWPECAEASLTWVGRRSRTSDGLTADPGLETAGSHEAMWRIANGRARGRSRRYFVRNRLRFMWVLTFGETRTDRAEVMWLVSEFARRFPVQHLASRFPYWYSPELHPGGHGWHVNLFVPMRVEHGLMAELWDHGFVWVTDFESSPVGPKGEPLGLCRTPRDGWRRAARYGCKYAQKDWSPETVGQAQHRYEVAQGFQPVADRSFAWDLAEGRRTVEGWIDPEARRRQETWDSDDDPEWDRPRVITWRW